MSTEEKVDLRIQKTEQALTQAMTRLLKEKPYVSITVSDICNTAMVRRATFYRHFHDKDDFLDFCLKQQLKQFESVHPDEDDPVAYYTAVLRNILRFMRDSASLLDNMSPSVTCKDVREMLAEAYIHIIMDKAALFEDNDSLCAPSQVIASFYAGALLAVAKWWHAAEPDMDEETLISHVQAILRQCFSAMHTQPGKPSNI